MRARRQPRSGLSPPTRGEPYRAVNSHLRPEVYPRPRGGTITPDGDPAGGAGLSPPTRGNLHRMGRRWQVARSIPAHAGEPPREVLRRLCVGVYPRPRGGTPSANDQTQANGGLSPPTRGNLTPLITFAFSRRSIPAHAGEPVTRLNQPQDNKVYPRPRGGTEVLPAQAMHRRGLSPPTRGNPARRRRFVDSTRSIPAHAGEPRAVNPRPTPRPRGSIPAHAGEPQPRRQA